MVFKKSLCFLLATFFGSSYSAESPVEGIFNIEFVENPIFWGQAFCEFSDENRVLIVLHWPNSSKNDDIGEFNEHMPIFMQNIKGNERVIDVYFWEQVPRIIEEDRNHEIFTTEHLSGYFYPNSSKLFIFTRISMFSARAGVPVLESDYASYSSFSKVINKVLVSILNQKFIYKKIIYLGEKGLLKYLKKDAIHQALDAIYKEADSPVQDFTSRVLGTPPRPIAFKMLSPESQRSKGLSSSARSLDVSLSNSFRLAGAKNCLKSLPLPEPCLACRKFPEIKSSTDD